MVEYAVLLILLVTLLVGGTELGISALASSKNTEAAKTGISEYAEVNQQRLNILNAEKQYLSTLGGYGCTTIFKIVNDYDDLNDVYTQSNGEDPPIQIAITITTESGTVNVTRTLLAADDYDYTCVKPTDAQVSAGIKFESYSNFIELLDIVFQGEAIDFSSPDSLASYLNSLSSPTPEADSPSEIISTINTASQFFSSQELISETRATTASEGILKLKALLLAQHYKLSLMPLSLLGDNGDPIQLSQAKIAIGAHDAGFSMPRCTETGYDEGFPTDRYIGREYYAADDDIKRLYTEGSKVYLFNPLPIDVQSCTPGIETPACDNQKDRDPNRGCLSKLSILIYGYTRPKAQISAADAENDFADETSGFRPGLPKVNQAIYSLYKKDINTGNLIPPGKLCSSPEACPNMPATSLIVDSVGPTGYYRWARASDTNLRFKYSVSNVDEELNNGFRPTFQIDCHSSPNPAGTGDGMNGNINDIDCQSVHSKVRIHTRYRKLFEGFLTFGLQELDVPNGDEQNALALFYNPKEVGVTGSKNLVGSFDSEIGPLGRNGLPTVKQFKDFRGCYEVDVETNQVSACN